MREKTATVVNIIKYMFTHSLNERLLLGSGDSPSDN